MDMLSCNPLLLFILSVLFIIDGPVASGEQNATLHERYRRLIPYMTYYATSYSSSSPISSPNLRAKHYKQNEPYHANVTQNIEYSLQRAIEYPISQLNPVKFISNQLRPVEYSSNKFRPVEYSSNKLRPVEYPTNKLRPVEYPTNKLRPVEYPTNKLKPVEYSSNTLRYIPIEYLNNQRRPAQYPSRQLRPVEYPDNQQRLVEDQRDLQRPVEYLSNLQRPVEYPSNLNQPLEYKSNLQRPLEYKTILQQPVEYENNLQHPVEYQSNPQHPTEYPSNLQQPLEYKNNLQQPLEYINKLPTPVEDQGDLEKPVVYTSNQKKPVNYLPLSQIIDILRKAGRLVPASTTVSPDDNDYAYYDDEDDSVQDVPSRSKGSTPGKPGIDYPILEKIPETDFDCKTQRYKGFFGDPSTGCQVWHYCDLNGGKASFLCPNGTIFSQVGLTCDWWFNVRCDSTVQLYVLNERLYKYILPVKPSFPEDYSGPIVDRYLTLKFQEKEEKRREKELNNTLTK